MNCYKEEVLKSIIENKKYDVITEYTKIIFPEKEETLIASEYSGNTIRIFKDGDVVNVLFPRDITQVQESSITNAISNGTIFDDADVVDNYARYIELSSLPYTGMTKKGIDNHKTLHIALSSVIGNKENTENDFDVDDVSLENGKNFLNDSINHKEKDQCMKDIINDYLGNSESSSVPTPFKRRMYDLEKEIESIKDISDEDCITDFDYDYLDMDGDNECKDSGQDDCQTETEKFYALLEDELNNKENHFEEGFLTKRPKKLKPIPRDIVPYVTVELNAVRDSNDQAMLSGYVCSKLELVDFYLNVIDTNDDRYIVPHTRSYLVTIQNELNRLLTQILRIRPVNKMDRVWKVNVNYPEGWNG